MKKLFIDCSNGAAGDMLTAALLELYGDRRGFVDEMNEITPDDVTIEAFPDTKRGITGTRVLVKIRGEEERAEDAPRRAIRFPRGTRPCRASLRERERNREHSHGSMSGVEKTVSAFAVSEKVRRDVLSVYGLLAEAESRVHGVPVRDVHFHEVGSLDAIADITGFCLLMERLAPGAVIASPVRLGGGFARCAHGIISVPAPAVLELLRGVPVYGGASRGELCTPTGAALLKYFASEFSTLPLMKILSVGRGMGKKNFPWANCVSAVLGETADF